MVRGLPALTGSPGRSRCQRRSWAAAASPGCSSPPGRWR